MQKSYFSRLKLWLDERFPIMNFISGAFIYLLAKAIVIIENPQLYSWNVSDLKAMVVPMAHLFLLRVFDEHKDFESDKIHYPNRVIQKGIFTLAEVRKFGFIAFILQIIAVLSISRANDILGVYLLMWFWTFLMTKEFFVKEWLKSQLFLYGLSHLVVTPLIFLCCLALAAGVLNITIAWQWALWIALVTGWIYEVTRKTKGQEEETGDMSYSKLWGRQKACAIILLTVIVTHVLIYYFFVSLNINLNIFWIGSSLLGLLTVLSLWKYVKEPRAKNRKANEGVMALTSLYAFLVPIIYSFL